MTDDITINMSQADQALMAADHTRSERRDLADAVAALTRKQRKQELRFHEAAVSRSTTMRDQAADLPLIACQPRQPITEIGTMRDDMTVMKAILQRMDGTISDLLYEVRAIHLHQNGLAKL
jgi:hypothetical protein